MPASLGELVVSLSANTAQFTGAMDKAAYQSQKRMDEMLKSANRLGAMIGTGLAAGAGAFAVAMKHAIDSADDLSKTAQQVGMTTEALSGLRYAADLSGVSAENLTSSLGFLNKSVAEGNPAFAAMGINVKAANGELKSSDAILSEVAGKFAGYKDGVEKSALAMKVFGKSGAELVPLLNSGADGLKSMADQARDFGLVVGKETAVAAEAFNDNLTRVQKTQEGIVTQLTADLLPTLKLASDEFVSLARNTDLVSAPANAAKVLFQTLAVVGSDVAFVFKMTGQEIGGIAAQLASFATLDFKGGLAIGNMMRADAEKARAELDAFQARIMGVSQVAETEAKKVASGGGMAAPIVAAAKAAAKAKKDMADLLTPAAKEYASAIEKMIGAQESATLSTMELNGAQSSLYSLMQSAEWKTMPETWQQTAISQAASATAMIDVANSQQQVNDMLAATPTAKLDESRRLMMLLKEQFDAGRISAEQFSEAAGTQLGTLPSAIKGASNEMEEFAKSAAQNIQSSMADFLFDPFKDGLSGMASGFSKILQRMAAEAAAAQIAKKLFGSMGETGKDGSAGSWGWVGTAATWASKLFAADGHAFAGNGNVKAFASGGAFGNGQILTKATPFRFADGGSFKDGIAGEAGPEGALPLKRMSNGKLGVFADGAGGGNNITINVNSKTGDPAEIRRSAAAGARAALGAMGGAQRYA